MVILVISPLLIDKFTYYSTNYNRVHPELQVFISDTASMSCLSNDQDVRESGKDLLNSYSNTTFSNSEICVNYRLNTWQSVGIWTPISSEPNSDLTSREVNYGTKILIPLSMTNAKYNSIKQSWIKFIVSNPKEYLQVKLIQLNQVMFSGDTFGLRIFDSNNPKSY